MDSLLSPTDASQKLSGLTGLLSSLGSVLNDDTANAGVFAQFLQQNGAISSPPQPALPPAPFGASAQNNGVQNNNLAPPAGGSMLRALKRIVTDLRHILRQSSGSDETDAVSPTGKPKMGVSNSSKTSTAQTKTGDETDSNDADNSSEDSSNSGDTPNPQAIIQVLSDLAVLMGMLEKRLEMAQAPAGSATETDAATGSSNISGTQGQATGPAGGSLTDILVQAGLTPSFGGVAPPTSSDQTSSSGTDSGQTGQTGQSGAPDPLTQLLAFLQAIEQKLAPSFGAPLANGPVSPAALPVSAQTPSPPALPDFAQVQKDVKELLASLQNAAANNNPPTDASSGVPGDSANTGSAAGPASTAGLLLKTAAASSADKSAQPLPENFFQFFNDKTTGIFDTPSTTNNFAAIDANGSVANQDSGWTGSTTQDNGASLSGGNAGNAGGLTPGNLPLSTSADGTKAADPYSFASQLSASRALTGGAAGLPDAVEQVLLQINRGVKSGNDQMTIQLQPADLGKINVKLDISADGKVQGTVVADNPATLNMLLKDVRSLERALQEAGLRADPGSLQFSLGGQGNMPGQTANNFANGAAESGNNTPSFGAADTSLDIPADANEVWIVTPGRVNLKV